MFWGKKDKVKTQNAQSSENFVSPKMGEERGSCAKRRPLRKLTERQDCGNEEAGTEFRHKNKGGFFSLGMESIKNSPACSTAVHTEGEPLLRTSAFSCQGCYSPVRLGASPRHKDSFPRRKLRKKEVLTPGPPPAL